MCAIQSVLFRQAKVNDKDSVAFLILSDEEVVRFDISMDETLRMNKLDSLKYLQPSLYDCFQRESFIILFEKGLKRIAKHLHDHDAFFSFGKILVNLNSSVLTFKSPR